MTDDPTKLFEQLLAEQRHQTQGTSVESAREKARLRNEIEQESRRAGAELSALVSILTDRNVPTAPLYRLASRKHPFWGAPSQLVSKYTKIDGRAWIVATWATGEDYTRKNHTAALTTEGAILSVDVVKDGAESRDISHEHKVPGEPGFTVWTSLQLEDIPFPLGKTPDQTARLYLETVNRNTPGGETYWGRHL
nr:hypothetical protein [Rhodococcus sp. (in: high G+C Gram-positive bacteria)]